MTHTGSTLHGSGVCWIGNARYSQPLGQTDARKWEALAGLGARLAVIGFSTDRRFRRFEQGAYFLLLPELPFAPLRYIELFLLAPALLLWLILRREVRIIVAQSPFEGAAGALAAGAARLFGRRAALVIESHGDFQVALFGQRRLWPAPLYRGLMRRAARYGLRRADVLRAVSSSTADQLRVWAPGKPVHQFMAWVDAAVFAGTPRHEPLSACQDLVYAGVLIPRKGVHTLIDAFARLAPDAPASRLWLVGKPENAAYSAELRAQVERLGLSQRVIFVGAVPQAELAGYMARARALVLASSSEGLPRVVVEAMLNGLAVVATAVSGTPDVIEDGVTGYLVPPEDVDALEAALRRMLADPDIDALGQRARDFARGFFSSERYIEGYRRLLESALS